MMSRLLTWVDSVSKGRTLYAISACATITTCLLNAVLPRLVALPEVVKTISYAVGAIAIISILYFTMLAIRVRNENEKLQESLAQSNAENCRLQESIAQSNAENCRLQESIAQSNAENCRLQESVVQSSAENCRLEQCATILHGINHSYRDQLSRMLGPREPGETLLEASERDTLAMVCQKISEMFTLLTGEKCMATVKLIHVDEDGDGRQRSFCETLARSELYCERDRVRVKYEIGTGKNTAFDIARRIDVHGVSHFFSPDLERDVTNEKYYNERGDWKRFYRSAIVVPIRYMRYDALGTHQELEELGFLAIDTMATHKLNGEYHVQHLAALADQMFNFMSLMRGRYHLGEPKVREVLT